MVCVSSTTKEGKCLYSFLWLFSRFLPDPFSCCWAALFVHMLLWDQLTHINKWYSKWIHSTDLSDTYLIYVYCHLHICSVLTRSGWTYFFRLLSGKSTELSCEYKLTCANKDYTTNLLKGWLSRWIKLRTKELDFFLVNMVGISLHFVTIHYSLLLGLVVLYEKQKTIIQFILIMENTSI